MTKVQQLFTKGLTLDGVFGTIEWVTKDAVIKNPKGEVVFEALALTVPSFWSQQTINVVADKYFRVVNGKRETSAKQMFFRVAKAIAEGVVQQKLIHKSQHDPFLHELLYMLMHGYFAFNSPVWFNVGVVEKPQASACFIQPVEDNMESITELVKREMRLFKQGSGTGTNFSPLRSSYERLSGGGWASGPVSFLDVNDAGAGATKSGGTTRRAAKMVILNANHPDILETRDGRPGFITCKQKAEEMAHDLHKLDPLKYTAEFNHANNVYETVGFQNANNSVSMPDAYMADVTSENGVWVTQEVKTGKEVHRYSAKKVWEAIGKAAHFCGDPGLQFTDTINKWHTLKNWGRINASNPCSEFLHLDNTACNLASLNLLKFKRGQLLDWAKMGHVVHIAIVAMEALVGLSSYPSPEITELSAKCRPLGIGFANLGALFMHLGLPYDSNDACELASAIAAFITGTAYETSAYMAEMVGPCEAWTPNKEPFTEVIKMHKVQVAERVPVHYNPVHEVWSRAGVWLKTGFRNSQVSVIAPTGTISFLMGCSTTGCEPAISLVSYKKMVGGNTIKMVNDDALAALESLGYNLSEEVKQKFLEDPASVLTQPWHLKVFETALGSNAVSTDGHLKMMAAIQPFVSGAISKTVNMAANCTPQDILDVYMLAWKLGLKAIAVFRDGCKLSQPVNVTKKEEAPKVKKLEWGDRKRLPEERDAKTVKFTLGGQDAYLTVGKYEDGKVGEMFVEISKSGSTLDGMTNLAMTFASVALQHGAPLETLVEKMVGTKFEPAGWTGNPAIPRAQSIPDYIGKWLELRFLKAPEEATDVLKTPEAPRKEQLPGPPCGKCGNMTVRAGSCYVCTSCGTTTGCG